MEQKRRYLTDKKAQHPTVGFAKWRFTFSYGIFVYFCSAVLVRMSVCEDRHFAKPRGRWASAGDGGKWPRNQTVTSENLTQYKKK